MQLSCCPSVIFIRVKYWFAEGQVNVSSTRGSRGGFLVVYGDTANFSIYDSVGHDDLLEQIASRNRLDKQQVLTDGIRLFFVYTDDGVAISGVRAIDNEKLSADLPGYAKIIRRVLK